MVPICTTGNQHGICHQVTQWHAHILNPTVIQQPCTKPKVALDLTADAECRLCSRHSLDIHPYYMRKPVEADHPVWAVLCYARLPILHRQRWSSLTGMTERRSEGTCNHLVWPHIDALQTEAECESPHHWRLLPAGRLHLHHLHGLVLPTLAGENQLSWLHTADSQSTRRPSKTCSTVLMCRSVMRA